MAETDKQKLGVLLKYVDYLNGNKMISLPSTNGCEFLSLIDIMRCEGDNNYTIFHLTKSRKLIVSKTLGEYEQLLGNHFFREHQSHLINLRLVKSYAKGGGILTLSDGSLVEILRRKKIEFFKLFSF